MNGKQKQGLAISRKDRIAEWEAQRKVWYQLHERDLDTLLTLRWCLGIMSTRLLNMFQRIDGAYIPVAEDLEEDSKGYRRVERYLEERCFDPDKFFIQGESA